MYNHTQSKQPSVATFLPIKRAESRELAALNVTAAVGEAGAPGARRVSLKPLPFRSDS